MLKTPKNFVVPELDTELDNNIFKNHPWVEHGIKTQSIKTTYLKKHVKEIDWESFQRNTTPWVVVSSIQKELNQYKDRFPEDVLTCDSEGNYKFNYNINTSTIYVKDYIFVNEDEIDVFEEFPDLTCPHLDKIESGLPKKPKIYKSYSLDIETYSIDPEQDSPTKNDIISAIGIYNDDENYCFHLNNLPKSEFSSDEDWLNHLLDNEYQLLSDFNELILNIFKSPSEKDGVIILVVHYGLMFDIPQLYYRFKFHNIFQSIPFNVKAKTKDNTSASDIFGKAPKYFPCTMAGVEIIDTYHLAALLNKSTSDFSSLRLKDLAIREGFTGEERRIELSVKELNFAVENAEYSGKFLEYLFYDVYETYELFKKYFPPIYISADYIPLSLQEIHLRSTAYQINKLIEHFYYYFCSGWVTSDIHLKDLKPNKPYSFEGGLGLVNPGIYGKNETIVSIDIDSQYPSIIENFCLGLPQDVERFFIALVIFLKRKSKELKQEIKNSTVKNIELIQRRTRVKLYGNSAYGTAGTKGYKFNDFITAALITAAGRKILKVMIESLVTSGGKVIEAATDGLKGLLPNNLTADELYKKVSDDLPKGFTATLESSNAFLCMMRSKNYILWENKDDVGKKDPKFVGYLNKRSTPKLYIYFTQKYLEKYYLEGYESAELFAHNFKEKINDKKLPLKFFIVTDKIAKNQKRKSEELEIDFGERVTYYFVEAELTYTKTGKLSKKSIKTDSSRKYKILEDKEDLEKGADYFSLFYIYKINEFHATFRKMLGKEYESLLSLKTLDDLYKSSHKQLSLLEI